MTTITDRLMYLTAGNLMTRDVMVVPQHMSLRAAANLLSQVHVSGAPVVDEGGACIGVISSTDFVRWADGEHKARTRPGQTACVCTAWQMVDIEALPTETVAAHMTADPVVVPADMTIQELARVMVDAHIHRVIVTDPQRRPIGIVSSTDLLAALARTDTVE
jgi:CBS-domain-containing membrane protein